MSTSINTNLASLFAQNSLSGAQNRLAGSVQRLSSGLRINSAKDDAAGLTIAQNMQSQINGVNQSIRNLSDATNLIQTAESSLSTIQDMLLRMKQLSTQGYNGSLSTSQKNAIVSELGDLNTEINATATRTTFNGVSLLSSARSVDNKTADVYAGQYLTTTAVYIDDSGSGLSQTDSYDIEGSEAIGGAGQSTYSIYSTSGSFSRDVVGTYNLTVNDDQLTMSYEDSDGSLQTQTLTVANATYDSTDHTTNQELNFDKFGITLNLSNVVSTESTTIYGATIASVFDGQSIVFGGESSKITGINLDSTESTAYTLTTNTTFTTWTTTVSDVLADDIDSDTTDTVTLNGLTLTFNSAANTSGVDKEAIVSIFANSTTGRKVGDVVDVTVAGVGRLAGTVGVYDITASATDELTLTATNTYEDADDPVVAGTAAEVVAKMVLSDEATVDYSADNILTVNYTKNDGSSASEDVTLVDSDFYADTDSTITFAASGISINIHNYQDRTAKEIAYQISALYGSNSDTTGVLNVVNSDASELSFQSGATSSSYIDVKTLNVMTGSNGVYEGSAEAMMAVGDYVTDTLADLDSSSADEDWQAAFTGLASAIDDAIDYISTQRAIFGSQINRLSFMTTNLQANSTNLQNSRSSIIDTDFAAETAALTKGQIMQQAATAMLAQANQMPNVILSLLK